LLFVGRLIEKKGIYLFLDTAKEFPEIGFHVVGGGAGEDALRKKYSEFPNITFHGVLSQNNEAEFNKLVRLYNICDFLVSPYLYDEGFSTTLIESLACGTPVIVTDRGSPPTFLNNMVAVYLPHDPTGADLAGAIKSIKFDDMYRNNMRIACRSYAEEKFGFSNADVIINSYEQP
jgi:glycosyltransferase involved in cell wall biosynthesis